MPWRGRRSIVPALALAGLATLLVGTAASAQSSSSGSCRQGEPCMRSGQATGTGLFNTTSVPLPGGGSIDLGPQTTFMVGDSGELEVQRGLVHLAVTPRQRGSVTLAVPGGTVTVRDGEVVITAAASSSQVQVIAGRAIVADTKQDDTLVVSAGMSAVAADNQVLGPQRMAPGEAAYRWWETGPAWWLIALIVIGCVAAAGMPVALLVHRRRDRRRIRSLAAAGLLS